MLVWKNEPFFFAPTKKICGGWILHKDAPAQPAAPDYTGAAQATASGNMDAAKQAQQANMVNQYTPYGSLTYSQDANSRFGSNPSYSSQVNLTPVGQQLLDYNNQSALGLAGLQSGAEQNVANTMGKPMDQSSVQQIADQAYKNYTSRLDPQWAQQQNQTETQLRNQGLVPGSEAYTNAMRDFSNAKNDAYTQANTASINTMPQTYQMANATYNQPLNALNALRTGSQVTNPSFGNSPQQQTVPGANYSGAAAQSGQYNQGLYNAGVGQANAFNSGLFQLGAAGIGLSDIRLKSNIQRIGTHPLGIGIYEYDIFGQRDRGVMAQEVLQVKPEAVLQHPSGYLMVNYGMLQ